MGPEDTLTLAALQTEPSENLKDIFLQIQKLTKRVVTDTPEIDCLVLPEYAFGTFHEWSSNPQENQQLITSIHEVMSKLAKTHNLNIISGSVPFQTEEGQWRNRSFLITSDGSVAGFYDKQNPFRAEKRLGLEPGTHTPVFRIKKLQLAILICSDLWYHNLIEPIAEKTDFLAVPTMTTVLNQDYIAYGRWAWQSLVAVRAKEYTIPIVSADQAFREYAPGVFTCGGTCIVDPSYRFKDQEGPQTQALKITANTGSNYIVSQMSLSALREYAQYRREVGLREE